MPHVDEFVVIIVQIVPIGQGRRHAAGQQAGVHRQGPQNIRLAGGGNALVPEPAHGRTTANAQVRLNRSPALDGQGVESIGFAPPPQEELEFGDLQHRAVGDRRGVRVFADLLEDFLHLKVVVRDPIHAAMASERSNTTVVGPNRCNCFSSNRQVQKASGRAPSWP